MGKIPRVKRARKRAAKEPKIAASKAVDLDDMAARGIDEVKHVAAAIAKSSWIRRLLKCFVLASIVLVVGMSAAIASLSLMIKDADVEEWIKQTVAQQTGGKIEFSHIEVSIPYGITLNRVRFTPPLRTDDRGYVHGGDLEPRAALEVERLLMHYSLPALFLLKLNIPALKLDSPRLIIDMEGEGNNLAGIARYRARHFPAPSTSQASVTDSSEPLRVSTLLPVVPSRIFMPFRISISDVGFENLRLSLIQAGNGTGQDSRIQVGPISALTSFHWAGTASKLRLKVFGQEQTKISVSGAAGKEIAIRLDNDVEIENFTSISLRLKNHLDYLRSSEFALEEISTELELQSEFSPVYTQYRIERLKMSLLDAIIYELKGEVSLPEDNFDVIRLNIKQNLSADIFALNQTLNQLLPESSLYGLVELSHLDIQGDIKPAELTPDKFAIPYVSGNLRLVDVKADLSELGLWIAPVNGNISLGAGPSMVGVGSQADAVLDLRLPNIKYAVQSEGKTYQLEVKDLETNLTARGLFPNPALPIFKLSMEAQHVVAKADDVQTADVPFELDVDLEVREGLSKVSAEANIELSQLLEAGIDADCRNMCEDLKLSADLDIRSLGQLFGIAQPILQRNLSLKNIPARLRGGVASKVTLRGGIKDLQQVALDSLIREGDLDINMYLNVNDVDLELPGYGLALSGFNNRVFADGNLDKVKLILKQDFAELRLSDDKLVKKTVLVENFRFETDLISEAVGPFLIKNPARNMKTSLNMNVGVTKIEAPGYTPRPINNPQIKIAALQERLRRINFDSIEIIAPDFGAEVTGTLEAGLDKEMNPQSVTSNFKVALQHGVGKALPSGVRSSGDAEFQISAKSDDMKTLILAGGAMFDHFSLDVPEIGDPNKTLIRVEDMHGSIPLEQKIDLAALVQNGKVKNAAQDGTKDLTFEQITDNYLERNRDLLSERENRILELDYSSVRPFFPKKTPLTIKQINYKTLVVKKMEVDLELRQNWFAINQFMFQFLNGKIQGGMQFAFNPAPVGINTTVHLTRLDTRKLIDGFPKLKKKSSGVSWFSDPYLDATMHLRYNLKNDEIDGGLDITSIGKEQLRMILFYIDPQQSNPTISQIRTALHFGEVSQVSVPIKNGFIGMNVDVNVLSAPIPLPQLRGFPIAQVVKNFKDQPETEISSQELEGEGLEESSEEEPEGVELDAEPLVH